MNSETETPVLRRSARKRKSLSELPEDNTPTATRKTKAQKMSTPRTPTPTPATHKRVADPVLAPPVLTVEDDDKTEEKAPDQSPSKKALLVGIKDLMGNMLGPLETRLSKQINGLDEKVSNVKMGLRELEARVVNNERQLEEKIAEAVDKKFANVNAMQPAPLPTNAQADARYWKARRCLRIWPVHGDNNNSLHDNALTFLTEKLKMDVLMLQPTTKIQVRRVVNGPRPNVKNEVCVEFATVELRDIARSAAFNLAGQGSVGLRLEIPHHLRNNFQALQNASYKLRQKYPDCKRNLRFDDERADLVLDFKTSENENWRKLRPAEAKMVQSNNRNAEVSADDLAELFEKEDTTLTGANAIELFN